MKLASLPEALFRAHRIWWISILAVVILALCFSLFPLLLSRQQDSVQQSINLSLLPDSTEHIHAGLVFNYNVSNPRDEMGKVDFVWGSQYATEPAGVYNTYYYPFDRDSQDTPHDITWFQGLHPDWIEYQCDKKTIAYEYGEKITPLDITNPVVLDYMFQSFLAPALRKGYQGIAFDNVDFDNQQGHRCGVWRKGTWIQQFRDNGNDEGYRQSVIKWAQTMYARIHTSFPHASMAMNFPFAFDASRDSYELYRYADVICDERGFTNFGEGYFTDGDWLTNMQALQRVAANNKGLFSINEEPGSFATISREQTQWVLANYLLIKGNHGYLAITGLQAYGNLSIRPEFAAPIGHPTTGMYRSQGVYMRDYSYGKAVVNPSSSQTLRVTLPPNTFENVYGNPIQVVSLSPHSGIVLLTIAPK